MSWYGSYGEWPAYVPVAQRKAKAAKFAADLAKKEKRSLAPVKIEGRKLAKSFWGLAWCDNLERYSDYANRLPRGATYARNGSVVDLQISKGTIKALVSGSEVYTITITIETLPDTIWTRIKQDCSQSIDSLLDLVQGKFDRGIMDRLTLKEGGLFPQPKEIRLDCSCPDSAGMCKHIAATMYGVGNRLDTSPELLFVLRDVDHLELISDAVTAENLDQTFATSQDNAFAGSDLGELFGIELDAGNADTTAVTKNTKSITAKKVKPTKKPTQKTAGKPTKKMSKSSQSTPILVVSSKAPKLVAQANSRKKTKPALATKTRNSTKKSASKATLKTTRPGKAK